ncbi:MAG: bifunctional 2-C-methyl-D-erythritol 4-phosphate cytidylyltransferase/2-C-methyl-D-erythritol 2,4-cyclodiphosphate synthase [Pseudomonadota bacterium]
MTIHALVVAAGRGVRAGPGEPKQYRPLAGRPVLTRTLEALAPCVDVIRVVIHPDDRPAYDAAAALARLGHARLGPPVEGGESRQESVRLGLEAIEGEARDPVLIHDAARPFPSEGLIRAVLAALEGAEGACPALSVADTLRRNEAGRAGETLDRAGLVRAQTPQAFRLGPIREAHRAAAGRDFTDDVAVAQAAGLTVAHTPGEEANAKLTTPEDLARAGAALRPAGMETRVGTGFDVHAFAEGDHVTLCGVTIPHSRSLAGHSDADVGMHALTDALLGAMAEGDIGVWFPPTDPQWRGARSRIFLERAAERLKARGGRLINADVTLICEAPKIGPHAGAMREALAEILGVPPARVSVKATTSEKLGFTGREEGIAAQAAASIALPAPPEEEEALP